LIDWKRLLFGLALGFYRRLKCQAGAMLAGNVFDGSVLHRLGLQCDATFERKDDLSDFDLLALLYSNFLHYSAHARWNLHHSLVGFEFHDWLAFGNLSAGRNHQADEVGGFDVLAKFRKLELRRSGGRWRWRLATLDLGLRGGRFLFRYLCFRWLCFGWLCFGRLGFCNFLFGSFGSCSGPVLNCEDDLADFDFLSLFYANVFYGAAYGRRNLDNGFVGFEFHHWLAFGNVRPRRDH